MWEYREQFYPWPGWGVTAVQPWHQAYFFSLGSQTELYGPRHTSAASSFLLFGEKSVLCYRITDHITCTPLFRILHPPMPGCTQPACSAGLKTPPWPLRALGCQHYSVSQGNRECSVRAAAEQRLGQAASREEEREAAFQKPRCRTGQLSATIKPRQMQSEPLTT